MVQKRPFDAEEILEVSFKHPRHAGQSNELVPLSESVFPNDDCNTHMPKTSEDGCTQASIEGNDKLGGEYFDKLPSGAGNSETSFPVIDIPASSWATSSTTEDFHLEPPLHLALFPEYFSPERPIRTLTRYEDIYSILLEHSPRKPVSVGANHQADVPAWDFSGDTNRPHASDAVSDSDFIVLDRDETERLMGTCVIPMPLMELSSNDDEVGKGRTDCSCEDQGSMRCVRQHIAKKRENLIKTFGPEKFTELGFTNMGEQVAEKWSAEDEQLFHEVVFNNPASLDKNFWNYLSIAFPSRTKKEIVSYYFNVFMLQRRAEQNRNDLLSIDSDNDEWQGSDSNDIATREEDEDSVAESPVYQDETCMTDCHDNDLQAYNEYAADETCAVNGTVDDDSKYDPVEMHHTSGSPLIQPQDQPVWQDSCDEKVKDDSCASSDIGVTSQETKVNTENGDHWCGNYNGVSSGYSQGYVLEPCDAEVWDSGFVSCSKNKIDFLPTCNMIEEVFGDGRRQDMRRA
ncbi:AT-rich interactive domain-containing protein 2 [Spatholobus suberectus]|nr:AT-rich interactive domain-containing protein 2 [Spatholobus suberectus]